MPPRTATSSPRPRFLLTADGVRIEAVHATRLASTPEPSQALPGSALAVVVAHGFTGSWRRPAVRAVVRELRSSAGVLAFDFRGHGRSGGWSTVGDLEVLDVDAVVGWARALGYARVVTVGWSMGASVVVRHAARPPGVRCGVEGVVAVSGPSRWHYRGTARMRLVHRAIETTAGRTYARTRLRTRIAVGGWDPWPEEPRALAGRISPVPLLVVHGDRDPYFPLDHAEELFAAAREPKQLWVEEGYGHAEAAATPDLVHRIARWAADVTTTREAPA